MMRILLLAKMIQMWFNGHLIIMSHQGLKCSLFMSSLPLPTSQHQLDGFQKANEAKIRCKSTKMMSATGGGICWRNIFACVPVDTMLLESSATAKAILDLIPVVNITNLIMGTKRFPFTRQLMMGLGKGEFVQKNAPDFCEVTIVYNGKKILNGQLQQEAETFPSATVSGQRLEPTQHSEKNFFQCIMCFSAGKFRRKLNLAVHLQHCYAICRPKIHELYRTETL